MKPIWVEEGPPKGGVVSIRGIDMVRRTSIETYNKIKANGLLSRRRWEVYEHLYWNGPMTCRELMMDIQRQQGKSFVIAGSSLSTRFSELERMGVIAAVRTRKCKETGHEAIEWITTNRLPIKLEKPKRRKCEACKGKGYFEEQQTKMF